MRTLKFRAWDKADKKYLYPESQSFVIVPTMPSFGVTIPYENHVNPDNIDECCFDWADADLLWGRYELEQYTGFEDKNGREVYEGDIVKEHVFYANGSTEDIVAPVEWDEDEGCYAVALERLHSYEGSELEVIGNIHENPGLLEEDVVNNTTK